MKLCFLSEVEAGGIPSVAVKCVDIRDVYKRQEYYTLLYSERASFFLDRRFKTVKEIRLDDLSSAIKLKYRKAFQFRFDQEEEEKPDATTARAAAQ